VYSLGLAPDQLSAMPSLHVGWAVLIAWSVIRVSDNPWRWLVVLHPACTAYVVAATANHFWLDGVVAVLVLGLCIVGQLTGRRAVDARRTRRQSSAAGRNEVDAEIAEAVA
jgi:hypothetical protein